MAGAVLALLASFLIAILVVLPSVLIEVSVAVGSREVANRGEVLFFKERASEKCSSAGQVTVFGPADPIFLAAVMRETVQPGSHVVVRSTFPARP